MRQANWHETGGNAQVLKGSEEEALREHTDQTPESFRRNDLRGSQGPDTRAAMRQGRSRFFRQPD